jgi:ubiquinone/menaquinone biosynthesis C-methylase UbiE
MEDGLGISSESVQKATSQLNRLGIGWEDIEGKTVLDVGTGGAHLAQAAKLQASTARIFSLDLQRIESWSSLSKEIKGNVLEADAEALPFPDNSMDLILNVASMNPTAIHDEVRVLKPGGEIRIAPIGGQLLEMWNVAHYLQLYKGWSMEAIQDKLYEFEQSIIDNDGFRPNEYASLQEAAIRTLTQDDKLTVINALVARYEEVSGLTLDYSVTNPEADEPNGFIVYRKPL